MDQKVPKDLQAREVKLEVLELLDPVVKVVPMDGQDLRARVVLQVPQDHLVLKVKLDLQEIEEKLAQEA